MTAALSVVLLAGLAVACLVGLVVAKFHGRRWDDDE